MKKILGIILIFIVIIRCSSERKQATLVTLTDSAEYFYNSIQEFNRDISNVKYATYEKYCKQIQVRLYLNDRVPVKLALQVFDEACDSTGVEEYYFDSIGKFLGYHVIAEINEYFVIPIDEKDVIDFNIKNTIVEDVNYTKKDIKFYREIKKDLLEYKKLFPNVWHLN